MKTPSASDNMWMSVTIAPSGCLASRKARKFFEANLLVLEAMQPETAWALREVADPQLTWVFGRDGSLTARDEAGRWWSGTSLPLRVGRELLKPLELQGTAGCFLAPSSCGQIRAALEKITAWQSIVVVIPNATAAWVAMHCEDFTADLKAGRLWVVCGDQWADSLSEILEANPGLCVPQQYIRTAMLSHADLSAMSELSNQAIATETARRAAAITEIRERWPARPPSRRVCVVAGSRFGLWNLADSALAGVMEAAPESCVRFDKDSPVSASPLALGLTMEQCDAIAAADLFRSDLAGVVANESPWLTWVTKPRVAPFDTSARRDRLVLADAEWRGIAKAAGWPVDRIIIAGWPKLAELMPPSAGSPIAMIADAELIAPPARLNEFSSQMVLWEQIAMELLGEALVVGSDIDAYLTSRMNRLDVDGQNLDRELFSAKLILPAWRRGIVRLLAKAGLPVAVFGNGWEESEEFRGCHGGVVNSIADLRRVATASAALIYPSPAVHAHAIDAFNRPVIRPLRTAQMMVRQAKNMLAGRDIAPPARGQPLSAKVILSIIDK
jgi:hypothetical protein